MAGLVEYSLLNGVDNDLVGAIEYVGGDTSPAVGVVDLAEVIRTQLISKNTVGTDWLFGGSETNNVWEEPTTSKDLVQADAAAKPIKQIYDLLVNTNRFLIHIVDELPTDNIDFSAIYLMKHVDNEVVKYTAHYFIKEGDVVKSIDSEYIDINYNTLFYITREEFHNRVTEVNNSYTNLHQQYTKLEEDFQNIDIIPLPEIDEILSI